MEQKKLLLIAGDGIGPEVMAEAKKVIGWFEANRGLNFAISEELVGGAAYDAHGHSLPEQTLTAAKNSDAVLLGAVGGPKWDDVEFDKRPEAALLGLRKELELFSNLRPAICFESLADASSLKREIISGLDILIVRELTGGIYFGEPRGVEGDKGFNTLVYTKPEIERIARSAFEMAGARGKKLCSVDKANVLESTKLWREVVEEVHKDFKDVELTHMYVDNAAMQLIRNPKQFDVIVTTNMFGDILSDAAAMLTGSLGMLPSASLAAGAKLGMYEPVHGSAPDIAGKNIANPIATILSFAMMLKYSFGLPQEAQLLEDAISSVLAQGFRTADIMQQGGQELDTAEMGDQIIRELDFAAGNIEKQQSQL